MEAPPGFGPDSSGSLGGLEIDSRGHLWLAAGMNLYFCRRTAEAWPWGSAKILANSGGFSGMVADPDTGIWTDMGQTHWREGTGATRAADFSQVWRNGRYQLFARAQDSVFLRRDGAWQPLYALRLDTAWNRRFGPIFDGPDLSLWANYSWSMGFGGFCDPIQSGRDVRRVAGPLLATPAPLPPGTFLGGGFDAGGALWLAGSEGLVWGRPETTALRPIFRHRRAPRIRGLPAKLDLLGRKRNSGAAGGNL
jgi:hypothetical protein